MKSNGVEWFLVAIVCVLAFFTGRLTEMHKTADLINEAEVMHYMKNGKWMTHDEMLAELHISRDCASGLSNSEPLHAK